MPEYDELKIYSGEEIQITSKITVMQPTLRQIKDFGEQLYFSSVYTLVGVGADFKSQLWDMGIDYTTIEDYDLFINWISRILASKKNLIKQLPKQEIDKFSSQDLKKIETNPLELILKDIDFCDFLICKDNKINQTVLRNEEKDITIDRFVYSQIVEVVRNIHFLKRNNQVPANERTKMDLIEDARDELLAFKNKKYKSTLRPLISSLSVDYKICNDNEVWDMNIHRFLDNIKRINKIQDARMLLQGAYSGFANLKGVDKTHLDWSGDL